MEKNTGKAHMAIFMFLFFLLSEAASDVIVVVHPGDDATLPCQAVDPSISIVEWSRDECILFYSDKETDTTIHNPSYKGRVDLSGNELNDGDASLILKNVSSIDNGTYECRVASGGLRRKKRTIIDSDPIRTIRLQVSEPAGSEDGNSSPEGRYRGRVTGVAVGLILVAVVAVVGVLMYKRRKDKGSGPPADDDELWQPQLI